MIDAREVAGVLNVTRVIHSDDERRQTAEEVEKRIIAHFQEKGYDVVSRGEILDFPDIDPVSLTGRFVLGLEERGEDGVRKRINIEKDDSAFIKPHSQIIPGAVTSLRDKPDIRPGEFPHRFRCSAIDEYRAELNRSIGDIPAPG